MTTSEAIRRAARLDREGRARFDAFAARVEARAIELGLRGEALRRYQDVALLVYRVASRRRRSVEAQVRCPICHGRGEHSLACPTRWSR